MENLKEIAWEAIACIKEKGADKGQVFVTESQQQEFNLFGFNSPQLCCVTN